MFTQNVHSVAVSTCVVVVVEALLRGCGSYAYHLSHHLGINIVKYDALFPLLGT